MKINKPIEFEIKLMIQTKYSQKCSKKIIIMD